MKFQMVLALVCRGLSPQAFALAPLLNSIYLFSVCAWASLCGTGHRTQGLPCARQVLCFWVPYPAPPLRSAASVAALHAASICLSSRTNRRKERTATPNHLACFNYGSSVRPGRRSQSQRGRSQTPSPAWQPGSGRACKACRSELVFPVVPQRLSAGGPAGQSWTDLFPSVQSGGQSGGPRAVCCLWSSVSRWRGLSAALSEHESW